jgi:hypothetical protein
MLAEFQLLRFTLPLLPIVLVALAWRDSAIALAQTPPLMVIVIWYVETRVLRYGPRGRARLIEGVAAERGLDLLRVQGRAALTRIAAGRGLRAGELRLVVEQSELARLPPLTFVTVQSEAGPEVLALDAAEREVLREELFRGGPGGGLDEATLLRINQRDDVFLREVAFDARGVSAHARLAAALARPSSVGPPEQDRAQADPVDHVGREGNRA